MVSLAQIVFIGVGYAISSSSLVIINKWALLKWPYSSSLTFVQLTVSWMVAALVGKLGLVEVDALQWRKVKAFSPACLIFFVAIACNMKLLQHANVDTFIVLRSLVPLFTTFAESFALGTPLPNKRVFATLIIIVIGSIGYVSVDSNFSLTAYFWGAAYVFSMVVDTVLVKKVVTDVELTPWGLVLYNNLIASALYPFFALLTGEFRVVFAALDELTAEDSQSLVAVIVSCVFGISISYFGLNARKMLQATAFSVLGIVCKFLSIACNTLLWEYHAAPMGIFWLIVCVSGGVAYQQVVKMSAVTQSNPATKQMEMGGKGKDGPAFSPLKTEDDDEAV